MKQLRMTCVNISSKSTNDYEYDQKQTKAKQNLACILLDMFITNSFTNEFLSAIQIWWKIRLVIIAGHQIATKFI